MYTHTLNSKMSVAFVAWLLALPAPSGVWAQGCPEWEIKPTSHVATRRAHHAMAYDSARQVTVLYGGLYTEGDLLAQTLEWNGTAWNNRGADAPGPRAKHAMAYDEARQEVVLFGGLRCGPVSCTQDGETWVWDGTTWILRSSSGPSPRSSAAMAYDSWRNRVVLFGGNSNAGWQADTWEWDGFTWSLRSTSGPPPQEEHAMAFDSVSGRTVLAGQNQTWEWNGTIWTLTGIQTATLEFGGHSLAFDSIRGVMLLTGAGPSGQSYERNGTQWVDIGGPYPLRAQHALAFDSARGVFVLFGGAPGLDDLWTWDGSQWLMLESATPPSVSFSPMAFDSDRHVTFLCTGVSDEYHGTWEFDGTRWNPRSANEDFGYRKETAMAYDEARQQMVLFGGLRCGPSSCTQDGETWVWDGSNWALAATTGPSRRRAHVMAYDSDRERVVLFGGIAAGIGLMSDTWEWDGTSWISFGSNQVSPARGYAGMAYDRRRHVMVLFGGSTITGPGSFLNDTWERVGTNWVLRTWDVPSGEAFPAMAYNAAKGVTVMRKSGSFSPAETWIWDGTVWMALGIPGPESSGASMVYDSARDRMTYFPSRDVLFDSNTWELFTSFNFPTGAPRAEDFPPCSVESSYATKNRYLSFVPPVVPDGANGIGLRVIFGPMPDGSCPGVPDFSDANERVMWVGQEALQGNTATGVFQLQTSPLFRDWTTVEDGVIQVSDCNIVPCASYSIQSISDVDYPNGIYSTALVLETTDVWGDVVGANRAQPANGIVDFIDISTSVDAFRNAPSAPRTWCDLAAANPIQGVALNIDFVDISTVVDAFRGVDFPFAGPSAPNPCP